MKQYYNGLLAGLLPIFLFFFTLPLDMKAEDTDGSATGQPDETQASIAETSDISGWRYLKINTGEDSSVIIRLLPGTSFRFDAGNFLFNTEDGIITIPFEDVKGSRYFKNAELIVKVVPEYPEYSTEGLLVEIIDADNPESVVAATKVNENGLAVFDIPFGWYSIRILGHLRGLENIITDRFYITLSEEREVHLDELLVTPFNPSYNVLLEKDQTYTVNVTWNKIGDTVIELPYTYLVGLNEELPVDTDVPEYSFTGLLEGGYTVSIIGIAPSGCYTEETKLNLEVTGATLISEIVIDQNSNNWKYFNFNGMSVPADNLLPGIYIRTNGKITEEILIK